jgi:heat shock protein HslJ
MKTRIKWISASVFIATYSASCAMADAPLAGSEWRPMIIGQVESQTSTEMFVRFGQNGKLEGDGGCNKFFGNYSTTGQSIEIGPLGATRMSCPDAVMDNERQFMKALGDATIARRDKTRLDLVDDAGAMLLRLTQTDAD